MTSISAAFWSPSIWLPPNITWKDFESRPESAQFHHLLIPFPLALGLVLLRLILEQRVFRPLGSWLGISGKRWEWREDISNLQQADPGGAAGPGGGVEVWKMGLRPAEQVRSSFVNTWFLMILNLLLRATGLPERHVERWKRRKAALTRFVLALFLIRNLFWNCRPSTLDKFAETGWRWLFYFLAHVFRFSLRFYPIFIGHRSDLYLTNLMICKTSGEAGDRPGIRPGLDWGAS